MHAGYSHSLVGAPALFSHSTTEEGQVNISRAINPRFRGDYAFSNVENIQIYCSPWLHLVSKCYFLRVLLHEKARLLMIMVNEFQGSFRSSKAIVKKMQAIVFWFFKLSHRAEKWGSAKKRVGYPYFGLYFLQASQPRTRRGIDRSCHSGKGRTWWSGEGWE